MTPDFVLASRSARRVQMLHSLGYHFECRPADIDERAHAGESPQAFARRMALGKARALAATCTLPVLGADTDVSVDGQILGKPRDAEDAVQMLLQLSDRWHQVHSAVAVIGAAGEAVRETCTEVCFGRIDRDQALAYWQSGEPADKAGAYAIQGLAGQWVREIRGSASGVIGLPLYETVELLRSVGIAPGFTPHPSRLT